MSETAPDQVFLIQNTQLGTDLGAQRQGSSGSSHARKCRRLRRLGGAGRSGHMSEPTGAEAPTPTPVHPMFDLDDIQAHYRIGRTKALELVNDPAFLRSVVPGMHRYPAAAVEAYDLAVALAGTIAEPHGAAPPVFVTPPALGKPGPKPGAGAARKAAVR